LSGIPYISTNSSAQAGSYEWTFDDGSPHSFDFEPVHTYDQGGIYDVTLLALNEYCGSGITVSIPVNYNSVCDTGSGTESPVRLFPNPANEQVTLAMNQESVSGSEVNIAFFDAKGSDCTIQRTLIADLAEGHSTEFQWQLAIRDLPSGIYYGRISTEKGGSVLGKSGGSTVRTCPVIYDSFVRYSFVLFLQLNK
jgi:hypothetical protein